MALDRQNIQEILLKSYQSCYNIEKNEKQIPYLTARMDYFEHAEKYVLSRKAELWSADSEEFLYLFDVPKLTTEIYRQCEQFVLEDGGGRMNIGPGHMYSYLTAVFVCDTADAEAVAALKKSRHYKSFHFSFHGWMDYRAALVTTENDGLTTNRAGKCVAKIMKKVLYSKNGRRDTQ